MRDRAAVIGSDAHGHGHAPTPHSMFSPSLVHTHSMFSICLLFTLQLRNEAVQCVTELQSLGVMRMATLEDGSLWCLTGSDHLRTIEVSLCAQITWTC